jgi:hypothetical protein
MNPVLQVIRICAPKLAPVVIKTHPILRAPVFKTKVVRRWIKPKITAGQLLGGDFRPFETTNFPSVATAAKRVNPVILPPLKAVEQTLDV